MREAVASLKDGPDLDLTAGAIDLAHDARLFTRNNCILHNLSFGPEREALQNGRLTTRGDPKPASEPLTKHAVRAGEIVGLTGLIGAGHEEVPYLLFGVKSARSGEIAIGGRVYAQGRLTPRIAIQLGMALLPNDRREASGIGSLTVSENVAISVIERFFENGFLHRTHERIYVEEKLKLFGVNPADPNLLLAELSGGNQQKALLAKWFQLRPAVLILHEPTQGVDIGSRRTIFQLIEAAAGEGTAVLIVSTEYADLANLCDRVLVVRRGRQVGELVGSDPSEQQILALSMME